MLKNKTKENLQKIGTNLRITVDFKLIKSLMK